MVIETGGYRGKKLWSVSLDNRTPVTVRAPDEAVALIRAAIYYGIDWLAVENRERFRVWRYGDHD